MRERQKQVKEMQDETKLSERMNYKKFTKQLVEMREETGRDTRNKRERC
jgi:hypothetical protein